MNSAELLPAESALRAWDWHADLRAQERALIWLARKTGTHYSKVYRYAAGQATPIEWLREVARVLGKEGLV